MSVFLRMLWCYKEMDSHGELDWKCLRPSGHGGPKKLPCNKMKLFRLWSRLLIDSEVVFIFINIVLFQYAEDGDYWPLSHGIA